MNGHQGFFLRVDLTSHKTDIHEWNQKIAVDFIGGKGVGAKILYDEASNVDPLGPSNLLLFGTGPLTGTRAPTSGRWVVVTKSPLTGLFLDSHVGGYFGAEIKKAGFEFK